MECSYVVMVCYSIQVQSTTDIAIYKYLTIIFGIFL